MSSLYFAAVMEAIVRIQNDEHVSDFVWAQVISKAAHNSNMSLDQHDAYYCAQRLMGFPFGKLASEVFEESEA